MISARDLSGYEETIESEPVMSDKPSPGQLLAHVQWLDRRWQYFQTVYKKS